MARSADSIRDPDGRQYHIGLKAGEVAPRILLVGDPARADRVAGRLESIRVSRQHREFVTHTGKWKGLDVTVMATGIGCDNTEIAVMELLQCERNPVFIRVGSCGALRPNVKPGELAISTASLRLEGTSSGFVEDSFPAVANHEVLLALISAATDQQTKFHVGLTATAPGFYGWQGRTEGVIPSRMPDLPDRLATQGVLNMEMEASTLFVLSQLAGVRAGAVCAVFANRNENAFIADDQKAAAEDRAIDVGLEALLFLEAMDQARIGPHYVVRRP
jgi:uridine phosphorylase